MIGSLVVDELAFPVTGLRLVGGELLVTAVYELPRETERLVLEPWTGVVLLGEDGEEVLKCRVRLPYTYTACWGVPLEERTGVPPRMTILLPVKVDEILGESVWT